MLVNIQFSSGFVQLPNETARDTSLSLQARAILLYIRSLPENWKIHPDHIAKENNISRNTFDKYLKQLRDAGYVEYVRFKNPNTNKFEKRKNEVTGMMEAGHYLVYPIPKKHLQAAGFEHGHSTTPNFGSVEKRRREVPQPQNSVPRESGVHINKELLKRKKTTTTEKPDFDVFALSLIAIIQEMINEGGWVAENQLVPKATWLKAKARSLFDKFPDPRPEDCAVLILKDWTSLMRDSAA